jgi:hypothetical protein
MERCTPNPSKYAPTQRKAPSRIAPSNIITSEFGAELNNATKLNNKR